MITSPTRSFAPLCLLALVSLAPAAFAATPVDAAPQRVVRRDDLDLSREPAVRILYQRLKLAAADVCPAGGRDTARNVRAQQCQAEVLDRAVADARLPRLTALHRERGGAAIDRLARR